MNLNMSKSFRLMKLLNHDYGPMMRALVAAAAYGGTMVTTRQHVLAKELAGRFWASNDFKLGARRGAWYFSRSWLNINASQDDFFDPTEGMADQQLTALKRFISARKAKLEPVNYATDLAFIAARRLNNNTAPAQRGANLAAFGDACNALLHQTGTHLPPALTKQDPRQGDFPIAGAKQALADFIALFPTEQMPWFLVSGTFLGLIRENGFLAHDYDIDFGVFEDQINISETCAAILSSDCFVLKKYDHHQSNLFKPDIASTNPDIPYILKIVHTSGVHIDLFIHYRDARTTPAVYWHGSSLHRWENRAFDLKSYQFYGHSVLGPVDADAYLTENYGDWRTPVTEFNCTTDTPNLALVPHPVAVVLFLRRYVFATAFDPTHAKQLEYELTTNGFLEKDTEGRLKFCGDLFKR